MADLAMTIGSYRSSVTSSVFSSGCSPAVRYQGLEDFGWLQFGGQVSWKKTSYKGNKHTLGGNKQIGAISSGCRNPFSGSSDYHLFSTRKKDLRTKVQVAADFSDSKSDPLEYQREVGYHPLEALDDPEKTEKGELMLTDAEVARTIVEVNNNATIMFSSTIDDELHDSISWPDLQYVTDENGDIYFEGSDEDDVLQSLSMSNTPVHVLIGLDDLQHFSGQETTVHGDSNDFDIVEISDSESDIEDDYEEEWIAIFEEEEDSDFSDSLGDWANLETMRSNHPLYFSRKLAEAVSMDYSEKMDRPSQGLAIVGLIRPAFMEEQTYVRKIIYDGKLLGMDAIELSGSSEDEELEESVVDEDSDLESETVTSLTDETVLANGSENDEDSEMGSSLYKLEIVNIQFVSLYGNQSLVSLKDFQQAEPDILSHSASSIIARINASGEKTRTALKSLCRRIKGIQVKEATIIGVDTLGIDVRILSGTQVQTLRFAFSCRATSEFAAERQLRHLLFPHSRRRRRNQREARHRKN